MIARRTALSGIGLGLTRTAWADEPAIARHLQYDQGDYQTSYMRELLSLALARSGRHYQLEPVSLKGAAQSRLLIEMGKAHPSLDVHWTITDADRERRLRVVRIPIDRGLLGWRVALVRRSMLERWKWVRTLSDLAIYNAVQMPDWPDTRILRANGIPVQTGLYYSALFEMLVRGHADFFPRSIMEIGAELDAHRDLDIAIEPYVLLHYPSAQYFFVASSRPRLAADIERGLETLLADGTLQRMFRETFGDLLTRYDLKRRVTLELHNPTLPPQTPLQRTELWWTPQSDGLSA